MKVINVIILSMMLLFVAGCTQSSESLKENNVVNEIQHKQYFIYNTTNNSNEIKINESAFVQEIAGYKLMNVRPVIEKFGGIVYLEYAKENSSNVTVNLIYSQNKTIMRMLNYNIENSGYEFSDNNNNQYILLTNGVSWFTNNQFNIVSISMDLNYSDFNNTKTQVFANDFFKQYSNEFPVDNLIYNGSIIKSYDIFYNKTVNYRKQLK